MRAVLGLGGVNGSATQNLDGSGQLTNLTTPTASTSQTYDAQGNRTTTVNPVTGTGTISLGWDQRNTLTSAGTLGSYSYDSTGLRTTKTVPAAGQPGATTTRFAYDTADGLPLIIGDGTTSYITGPGGLPLEQITATGTTWYHHDQLGSTRATTSSTGTVTYTPYGTVKAATGTQTVFGYAGQYTDPETGYQWLRARYYNPVDGEFLSTDPLMVLSRNAFGYVDGSPLDRVDPLGLRWGWSRFMSDVGDVATVGAAVLGTAALLTTAPVWVAPAAIGLGLVALGTAVLNGVHDCNSGSDDDYDQQACNEDEEATVLDTESVATAGLGAIPVPAAASVIAKGCSIAANVWSIDTGISSLFTSRSDH